MRLKSISESFLSAKLKEIADTDLLFKRPGLHKVPLYDASRGFDSDSKATTSLSQKKGIPLKPRHRKYFGISTGIDSSYTG